MDIEPCPCGAPAEWECVRDGRFYISCSEPQCWMGPTCDTREQAIAAWNRVAGQRWRPIETAPRDGTPLDLWIVPPSEAGPRDFPVYIGASSHRITDVTPCYQTAWQSDGRTITGRRFYDEDGHECLDPNDTSGRAIRATHWRPLPDPPKGETDGD